MYYKSTSKSVKYGRCKKTVFANTSSELGYFRKQFSHSRSQISRASINTNHAKTHSMDPPRPGTIPFFFLFLYFLCVLWLTTTKRTYNIFFVWISRRLHDDTIRRAGKYTYITTPVDRCQVRRKPTERECALCVGPIRSTLSRIHAHTQYNIVYFQLLFCFSPLWIEDQHRSRAHDV